MILKDWLSKYHGEESEVYYDKRLTKYLDREIVAKGSLPGGDVVTCIFPHELEDSFCELLKIKSSNYLISSLIPHIPPYDHATMSPEVLPGNAFMESLVVISSGYLFVEYYGHHYFVGRIKSVPCGHVAISNLPVGAIQPEGKSWYMANDRSIFHFQSLTDCHKPQPLVYDKEDK